MIVLDTHVWLWLLYDYEKLSAPARALLTQEKPINGLRVSAISVWKIALKIEQGKLALPLEINDWYEQVKEDPSLIIEPVIPEDAIASTQLPGTFHKS